MRIANEILIPEFRQYIAERKEVLFTPSGVSMRPFIEGDRDSVVLTALDGEPRIGDILLAGIPVNGATSYVLHRLVRQEHDQQGKITYVLQGDGNLFGEERCAREDIIARITAIKTPDGRTKPLTRGRLWFYLKPLRKWLLKLYRHTWLKWCYN
jgi:hypothetical protein